MAPNKKYLSLEEAAALLGIKVDELVRFREKGDVRGFADRGTWKFKADDVAEFRRRRQPDSDPDLPIMDDFGDDENDDPGRQATVIRKGGGAKSDSDVRLMSSDGNKTNRLTGSSGEVPTLDPGQSDSDVRLIEPAKKPKKGSDSDVTLVKPKLASKSDSDSDVKMIDLPLSAPDSDSDVMLSDPRGSKLDSDSDVRLSPLSGSDSDVKLIGPGAKGLKRGSDSDVTLLSRKKARDDVNAKTHDMGPLVPVKGGSDLIPGSSRDRGSALADDDDSSITLAGDSGIQLAGDSGIRLASDSGNRLGSDSASRLGGDSGIRLDTESGIRLGTSSGIRIDGDSGIRLADDSGVELRRPTDSGISLEGPDSDIRLADSGINFGGDSGINLMADSSSKKLRGGSSKKLKGSAQAQEDDLDMTSPMLLSSLDEDDDLGHTSPLLAASNISDPEMFDGSDTSEMQSLGDSGQNVVMFDDEDEDSTPAAKKPRQRTVEESIFEMDEAGDELEVSDDDLSGGEHEIDDLAFDDDEDSQDESFTTGTSQLGYGTAQKFTVAQEAEWSAGFFSLLLASVCVMIFGSLMSADMLRTVWADGSAVNHGFAGLMGGLWK